MVESKQVRVDNWGIFFLQRLQLFFSKTDYCDLTLQFEGNVQLKVHRLVMNACTEYFMLLEQTCPALEENTILMPADLQSDVIVPIVNFMYTGMLEFRTSIFDKLYKAAELMNITVLTKLLEAQKIQMQTTRTVKSKSESKIKAEQKKSSQKSTFFTPELPSPLPGRKVPVWKRKTAPTIATTPSLPLHHTSQMDFCEEPRYSAPADPLSISDNEPKPTRFEWPEDELPPIDTSFGDFSLTSKPLLTKEEEEAAQPCFDDLRNNVEIPKKNTSRPSSSGSNINTRAVEEYVKEQRIRSSMFEDVDDVDVGSQKRKLEQAPTPKVPSKKMKISNKENKETTISVEGADVGNIDHTKIVTEILKKYPDLVKKNKNIKLRIMASGGTKSSPEKKVHPAETARKPHDTTLKYGNPKTHEDKKPTITEESNEEGPWVCRTCFNEGRDDHEFVLYYLYRKHMTDIHNEVFDASLCKYCGRKCSNHNLMLYHLYTKHALNPPSTYNFPKCDRCPYIAFSEAKLHQHKEKHNANEMQCVYCKLAFVSHANLTAHIRLTGHYQKSGRVNYDCQYCMKKLQSAINLFTHIKNSHLKEAKRDGIVCLDEIDKIEHLEDEKEEEGNSGDEYIVPEIMPESGGQKDKVKIISNVKVPPNRQSTAGNVEQPKIVPLQTSSEAESLNNVASGIATSLGIVDIVVLDENQQYILQDGQHEQTEFIIPELASGQPFAGQVITSQHNTVIPQGMIQTSGSDIASTDELVMVLTDHDYPDEQDGGHQENSNIVVLYSHPVEGQEGQFITSQGNLLVNSQTGMLEIRNGTTIATSSSQVVVTNAIDSPVESIEMIQREIEGHRTMKQEPYFEEGKEPEVQTHQTVEVVEAPENVVEELEETVETENGEQEKSSEDRTDDSLSEQIVEQPQQEEEQTDNVDTSDDRVDGSIEEPMEIEEIQETATIKENESQVQAVQETADEANQSETTTVTVEDASRTRSVSESEGSEIDGVDVPPERRACSSEESEQVIVNDPSALGASESASVELDEEQHAENVRGEDEPMEVDGKVEESAVVEQQQTVEKEENEREKPDEEKAAVDGGDAEENKEQAADPNEVEGPVEEEELPEEEELAEEEEEVEEEEDGSVVEPVTSEVSKEPETIDANVAESPRRNKSRDNREKSQMDLNKTILDDWGDESDSQQSEKQTVSEEGKQSEEQETAESVEPTAKTSAVEKVNKLMDDWEEEEEDDKKESE